MMEIIRANLRVFIDMDAEDEKTIRKILKELVPVEKLNVEEKNAMGFNEKPIKILQITLTKTREIKVFITALLSHFSDEQKELLKRQIESRLDENHHFCIRLDKDKLANSEYFITDRGNCYHIALTIVTYPKNRVEAIKGIKQLLS